MIMRCMQTDRASEFVSQNYLARAGGVVDRVTNFVYSNLSLITMQNVVILSHILCAHVSPKDFFGTLDPSFLGLGVTDH